MVSFHGNKNPKTGEFGIGVRIKFLRVSEIALKYFCHFVLCFGKFSCFSDKSNLRKEGIILSHSYRYNQSIMTIMTGKSRQQDLASTGHIAATVGKKRTACSAHCIRFTVQDLYPGMFPYESQLRFIFPIRQPNQDNSS